jgi:hypothetical protein
MAHFWSGTHEPGYGTPRGQVTAREVILWLDTGNPHTESGTSCTHAAFLAGSLHEVARSTLGPRALEEMLAVVRGAAEDPAFAAEYRQLREARAVVDAIPHDPSLPSLLSRDDVVYGRWSLAEGARVPSGPEGETLTIARWNATIHAAHRAPIHLELQELPRGFVFAAGVWVIQCGGIVAFDPRGVRRSPAELERAPWRTLLRAWDVYAVDDRALIVFDWAYVGDGEMFVSEFRPDEGLVGRCALTSRPPPKDLPAARRLPRDRFMD